MSDTYIFPAVAVRTPPVPAACTIKSHKCTCKAYRNALIISIFAGQDRMTPMKRFLLYILLLLPAAGHTCGREFRQFTTEDGLSDNAVLNLYQDEYGMIWAGTRNGLNQYNGNGFKVYKYRKGDRDGIQDNHIRGITGNRDGKIFIITFGISELDIKTGIFRTITEKETNAIFWHGALYAGIGRKVLKYDGEKFEEICEIPDEALGITSLGVDDEFMLIGTETHGLYLYDSKSAPVNIIRHDRISSVFHDRNGRWWVGTWHNGAYIIDGNSIRNIRSSDSASSGLSSDFVRSFCQDVNGDIWIGTFNGINVCNPETMEFTMYTDNNAAAGYSSVWSLLCDIQGNIWAGTYFDGIYLYPEDEDVFRHWKKSQDESTGLRSNMVREFIEDRYGNLWIATDGGGLGMLDKKRQTFRWYSHDSPAGSVTHDNITSLYYDDISDRLWIGTHLGGLNCMDIETGKFTYYHGYENDSFVNSDVIRDVERFNDRLLIITDKGISVSDPATGMSEPLFADNRELINDAKGCTVDSDGNVWIYGGGFGIYVWNPDNDEFRRYSSEPGTPHGICSNSVNKVFQDSKGRIWLCNRKDGIDLYDPQTDGFTNIDEAHNSLADNCVYNVAELPSGRLVFTTDSGFSILNDTSFTFTNYDRGNGVPLSAINETALYVTAENEVFIGADNGMVSFREEDLNSTPSYCHIHPFRLTVLGNEINARGEDGILDKPLMETERLVLKSSQSMFSIEYVTSDYVSDDEKNLEYFMDGLSTEWTDMNGMPIVTFTHLNRGKYTLSVRQKNSRSDAGLSMLRIIVLPPVWQSWWAILLYVTAGSAILIYIVRNYRNHVHLMETLKYEKSRNEDIETLNKSKIRFFTGISHEFRTPLTLIAGNAEMLIQADDFSPESYSKISAIYKNSRQMLGLITELLDFSKLGNGHMKIKVSEHNLVKFSYETFLMFKEYARYRDIAFDFVKTESDINVWFDSRQMQKVINNLISNAFKHTKNNGRISVIVRRDGPSAVIEVNDNGSGIPQKDISRIFDRFYQSEYQQSNRYTGTGIGLSLSKGIVELHHGHIEVYSVPGEGSSFKVFLQTGNTHFSAEELDNTPEAESPIIEDAVFPENPDAVMSEPAGETGNIPENNVKAKHRMLIAEDNDALREMLVRIFDTMYDVIPVTDGDKAWETIQARMPDIVISDIIMPGLSGIDLCRMIKTDISTCHIPVVLLTAKTGIRQNLDGLYAGADDYISKPFNVKILAARCNNLMNNRIMLRNKFSHEVLTTPQILATNPMDKKLLDKVTKAIENHIDDTGLNAETLTSEIGISRTKLFLKLKSIIGMTPSDFILTVRLEHAATMLTENPELNISEIADRLGFSSPRQFSRFFKAKYGIIPKQYRENNA